MLKKIVFSLGVALVLLLPRSILAACQNTPASICYVKKIESTLNIKINDLANGVTGPIGPVGPSGATGPVGPTGITGPMGLTGAQGLQGDAGAQGPQGLQGDTGAQGLQGDAGAQGLQGDAGAQGLQGDAGAQGPQGAQGNAGTDAFHYEMCDEIAGGVVFWVDGTGTQALIAAKADQSSSMPASPLPLISLVVTGAIADGMGAGMANTTITVAREAIATTINALTTPFAAWECMQYQIQDNGTSACASPGAAGASCYADWYLPSLFELNQLYHAGPGATCGNLTGFAADDYWSSTENSALPTQGMIQSFDTGSQSSENKSISNRVRCIRKVH